MNLVSITPGRSKQEYRAEFSIGVQSCPYLADHKFQEMVVFPGAFFLAMAEALHQQIFKEAVRRVEDVNFHSPVILGGQDQLIGVDVVQRGDSVVYQFFEATQATSGSTPAFAASLRVPLGAEQLQAGDTRQIDVASFESRAEPVLSAAQFYGQLRENGNQYGAAFQNISAVRRAGDEVLGQISVEHPVLPSSLSPMLLDSATQLLAAFLLEQRRGFLLRSIDKVELTGSLSLSKVWGRAHCTSRERSDNKSLAGDVELWSDSGNIWARLTGVAISPVESVGEPAEPATVFSVASNFTAELVEDSLRFWANYFGLTAELKFAPYNQLFQQLLDSDSLFHKNRGGANFVLLSLEEWANANQTSRLYLSPSKADECFRGRNRHRLPGGLEVAHLNVYETDYVFKEIFEDQTYLKHGIKLSPGATVLDIGANIGLFSLFVTEKCPNAVIYAYEPAPAAYEALTANCAAYGANVKAFNVGVAEKQGTGRFTFYENSSVFSGFHAEEEEDGKAIRAVVRNALESVATEGTEEYVQELSSERLRRVVLDCPLVSVSEIIRANGIQIVDLLKIDAEKSELEVLRGIEERDWPRIRQIVMEIHDRSRSRQTAIVDLLRSRGFRCAVEEEKTLADSGLVNVYARRVTSDESTQGDASNQPDTANSAAALRRNIDDFCNALNAFRKTSGVSLVVCICPPSSALDPCLRRALDEAEQTISTHTAKMPDVAVVSSDTLVRRYPVAEYHDTHAYHAGHVPYTPEGFTALGTALFRAYVGLQRTPFKVIVLDCDETLWQGVCGEDGAGGVRITRGHRELQEFMLAQSRAGMLLTLCSKNTEQDVWDVLEQRSDMVLRREHVANWRINWNSKSENIKDMARELNIGLDSILFLDDNPVDCAEVRSNCQGVVVLQLPRDPERIPVFLQHVWPFDRKAITAEDHARTKMYQENAERERFRDQIVSLPDFIDGLQLRIDIRNAAEADFARVSQLTLRTNQFNFTTRRHSESEIRNLLSSGAKCLVVRVADRFGDYGLVGILIYRALDDCYAVDTFLLSCRVLGRGVEHAALREIGRRAVNDGKTFVELSFCRSGKNAPAEAFLATLGGEDIGGTTRRIDASSLSNLFYHPGKNEAPRSFSGAESAPLRLQSEQGGASLNQRLPEIAERLYDVEQILTAIAGEQSESPTFAGSMVGETPQTKLSKIWCRVLGRRSIGMNENFFEAGGTSLKAVQLVASIKRELLHSLPIAAVFECPTVTLMAAKLSGKAGRPSADATSKAVLRGRQRRYTTVRTGK